MGSGSTRWSRLALRAPVLVALLVVGSACRGAPGSEPEPSPSVRGTPLERIDTRAVLVARGPFCERLSVDIVELALGAPARAGTTYASGQRTQVAPGVRDVVHENGCTLRAGRAVARAWVFAPPVTRSAARTLTASAAQARGCAAVPGAPEFGRPTVATLCANGGLRTAAYHGLFGDAWLSCSLSSATLDRDTLLDRTGRWCAEVLTATAP